MYCGGVDGLNYNQVRCFWAVGKEGSVAGAGRLLHLAQPTVSGHVRALEGVLGHRLLRRAGRGVSLTEMGKTVFRYADDIFSLGEELLDTARGRAPSGRVRLRVGVADVLPKLVVYRLLLPVMELPESVRVVCSEGKPADLLGRLVAHDLDVVLADTPAAAHPNVRVYSHRLGESRLGVFGTPELARRYKRGFPGSLEGAPFLLSTPTSVVRRTLDAWFARAGVRPSVRCEFEDSALLKVFGQAGVGLFVAPTVIEREVRAQSGVRLVGRLPGLREQFYAISMERRVTHPAVAVLMDTARARLSRTT
jgi:LysR family transcriptional activator of nhaA